MIIKLGKLVKKSFGQTQHKKGLGSIQIQGLLKYSWQRPTLPQGFPSSTIGARGLNFSVRKGKRCDPSAIATRKNIKLNTEDGKFSCKAQTQSAENKFKN
jgi:hypothetical protein